MKQYIALACCALLLFSFAGCGQTAESTSETTLPSASSPLLEERSSAAQQENAGGLADPAVASAEDLIEPAMEVYSWFALGGMPLAAETKTAVNPITGTEDTFQRVDSTHFSTYAEMEAYLGQFFSEEIIRLLLEEYPLCQDIDGVLYMIPAGRGANIFIQDVTFSTEDATDITARLSASVSYAQEAGEPENPKSYQFICEKIGGKWVFTTFEFYL